MALEATINPTRRLGVEHEFAALLVGHGTGMDVQRSIANVFTANGIRAIARGYSHEDFNADIAVEYDSSVHGTSEWEGLTHYPIEMKTRPLTYAEWEQIVPKALQICQYMGGRANASCGMHAHVCLKEFTRRPRVIRSLWAVCSRYQNIIFGLVPPSRRNNTYCRPLPGDGRILHGANSRRSIQRVLNQFDRFHWLNLTNLWGEFPHVEFRIAGGTLDVERARHWARFCLRLVDHACTRNCQGIEEPLPNNRKGIEALLIGIGLKVNTKVYAKVSPELRETGKWLLKRWKHFNGQISQAKYAALTGNSNRRSQEDL